jgi:FlaA1/EpsC-like NDP-sugar epimerase
MSYLCSGRDSPLTSMTVLRPDIIVYRRPLIVATQLLLVTLSLALSFVLRFDVMGVRAELDTFVTVLPAFLGVKLVAFYLFGLFRGWWKYVGVSDLLDIIKASAVCVPVLYLVVNFGLGIRDFSRSIYILDAMSSVILLGGVRFAVRLYTESVAAQAGHGWRNVLVIGAGLAGRMLVREIKQNPSIPLRAVGFVDDDLAKQGARFEGVPVLGPIADTPLLAARHAVGEILIAIPTASGEQMTRIVRLCQQAGVTYKTVPGIADVINGRVTLAELRDVSIDDLLGREVVDVEVDVVRGGVSGRRILITGAGGSIGSELARQIAEFAPASLILFERSENDLFRLENELRRLHPRQPLAPVPGDVVDEVRVAELFAAHRPEVVFHAAAYKHVPMMEREPFLAVQNNVLGSWNVASAAARAGVERFVFVSTDKAVNPTNIMGVTKRVGERAVLGLNGLSTTRFSAVRFGNVLGSSGSVVPLFREQIAAGQPVTVTDPDVTRYFMTIPEAIRLVLQATAMAAGGEIFILEMGTPVRIVDLAHNLIRLSGLEPDRDIRVVFTGLRPGEKMIEEIVGPGEVVESTDHPKVVQVRGSIPPSAVAQDDIDEMARLCRSRDLKGLVGKLLEIVPEYSPSPELRILLRQAEVLESDHQAAPPARDLVVE